MASKKRKRPPQRNSNRRETPEQLAPADLRDQNVENVSVSASRRGRGEHGDIGALAGDPSSKTDDQPPAVAGFPSQVMMLVISVLVVVHLLILGTSYSAIVEPSDTQSKVLAATTPYLRATHFAADGRPFYLAHGTPDEQPHRLQYASLSEGATALDSQTQWTTIEPGGIPGLARSDRYARWMGLVRTLSESDQPSLVASLLLPLVRSNTDVDAVRLLELQTELSTQIEPRVVYRARVVRSDSEVRMIAIESTRLTTSPRNTSTKKERVRNQSGSMGGQGGAVQ